MTETINPDEYMRDAKGRFWPVASVKEIDKLTDQTVGKIRGYAEELSAQILRFKTHTFDDINAHIDILNEQYGVKKGGQKGNVSLTSFDGLSKVTVQIQDHLDFGPELQAAKQLIDECLLDWSADSNIEIRSVINHAFNIEKTGKVNREALFRLRSIQIDDERWQRAIQAINDSIRIVGSKSYIRFYRRDTPEDRWQAITIDLAAA